MAKLAFVVCVSKSYEGYLPFYILFNHIAYGDKDYETVAYVGDGHKARIGKELSRLKSMGCKFTIKRIPFGYKGETPQAFKYYRWIVDEGLYLDHDYIYFGDVDILQVKEKVDILDYHKVHSAILGLPYSNYVRRSSKRMSGLHFIDSSKYYPKIYPLLERYKRLVTSRKAYEERNEVMLYNMILESGMGLAPYNPVFEINRHHGFHLRVFIPSNVVRAKDYFRIESFKYKDEFQKVVQEQPMFWALYHETKFKHVKAQLEFLFQIASINTTGELNAIRE